MLSTLSKFVFFSGLLYEASGAGDSHDSHDSHDHDSHDEDGHDHETCACVFEEYGLTIDCTDSTAITTAFNNWFSSDVCTNNATADCGGGSEQCQEYYYIIQAHHDYCSDDFISDQILEEFHEMEEAGCEECHISKMYDASLDSCPTVDCTDATDAALQVTNLATYNCATDCSSNECKSAFQLIRAYHDACEDGDAALIDEIETGIHSYEDPCSSQECNAGDEDEDATICTEDDDGAASKISIVYNMGLMAFVAAIIALW